MMRKTNNEDAFFLLEVMLTVTMLSIGLVYVIRSINTSLRATKTVFNYSKAIHFIYEKANQLELIPDLYTLDHNERKQESGVFESDSNFRWDYTLEKLQDYNLSTLVVDVAWKEGKREGSVDITTYLRTLELSE